jgi:hypothetical protein
MAPQTFLIAPDQKDLKTGYTPTSNPPHRPKVVTYSRYKTWSVDDDDVSINILAN